VSNRVFECWICLGRDDAVRERHQCALSPALHDSFANVHAGFAQKGCTREVTPSAASYGSESLSPDTIARKVDKSTPAASAIETTSCAHGPQSAPMAAVIFAA